MSFKCIFSPQSRHAGLASVVHAQQKNAMLLCEWHQVHGCSRTSSPDSRLLRFSIPVLNKQFHTYCKALGFSSVLGAAGLSVSPLHYSEPVAAWEENHIQRVLGQGLLRKQAGSTPHASPSLPHPTTHTLTKFASICDAKSNLSLTESHVLN